MQLPLVFLGVDLAYRWVLKVRRGVMCAAELLGDGWTAGSGGAHPTSSSAVLLRCPSCGYQYQVGDTVYVRAPILAPMQWHAFTINSVDTDAGYFTLVVTVVKPGKRSTWSGQLAELVHSSAVSEAKV
jgi:hypothetical protein